MSIVEISEETFTGKTLKFKTREHEWGIETVKEVVCRDSYKIGNIQFNDGDNIIVVGAHLGAFTLLLTTLGKKLNIYAYEPVLENYNLLVQNIKANPSDSQIHAFRLAIGERKPKASVSWLKYTSIVDMITLEDIFTEHNLEKCKLIKFDCEGCEYNALGATPKETLDKVEYIVGEWHWRTRWELHDLTKGVFSDGTLLFKLNPQWSIKPAVGFFAFINYRELRRNWK